MRCHHRAVVTSSCSHGGFFFRACAEQLVSVSLFLHHDARVFCNLQTLSAVGSAVCCLQVCVGLCVALVFSGKSSGFNRTCTAVFARLAWSYRVASDKEGARVCLRRSRQRGVMRVW
jgi:hypothetical protein